jgi:hypothetical protein
MNSISAVTFAGLFNENPKKQAGFRVISFSKSKISRDFIEIYIFK